MTNKTKSYTLLVGLIALFYFSYRSYLKRNPIEKNLEEETDVVDVVEEVITSSPLEPISEYQGNSLEDGASPFDALYGKGKYAKTSHSLTIKNTGNTDVVVFLVSLDNDKVIRNEYVRARSSFEMTNLPEATCYVKYYYGENWNPTRKTKDVTTGGFDNAEQHIISNQPNDRFTFKTELKGDYIYSSNYVITLETIHTEGTSMSEEKIRPSEFF